MRSSRTRMGSGPETASPAMGASGEGAGASGVVATKVRVVGRARVAGRGDGCAPDPSIAAPSIAGASIKEAGAGGIGVAEAAPAALPPSGKGLPLSGPRASAVGRPGVGAALGAETAPGVGIEVLAAVVRLPVCPLSCPLRAGSALPRNAANPPVCAGDTAMAISPVASVATVPGAVGWAGFASDFASDGATIGRDGEGAIETIAGRSPGRYEHG